MFTGIGQDIRLSIRTLLASPLVYVPALLTLAVAIGANAAVFSVLNSLLLRPAAVHEPEGLHWISSDFATSRGFRAGAGWNHVMWEALQERAQAFAGALAWQPQRFVLGSGADTESVNGFYGSGGLFTTLGIHAAQGRLFTAEDDRVGGGANGLVGVISARLWHRRFARSGDIIGKPLAINGVPVTIVGVTAPEFAGFETGKPFDVALPIGAEPLIHGKAAGLLRSRSFLLFVLVRLRDNQPVDAAAAALRNLQREIVPASAPAFVKEPFTLVPLAGGMGPTSPERIYGQPLIMLLGGMTIVLLVACVNIANLMLARGIARQPEVSLRLAVGAPRWRVVRAFTIDGMLLALAGGALGLVLAAWGSRVLISLTTFDLPAVIDWRVIVFTAAITTISLLAVGVAPALRTSRAAYVEFMKSGSRVMGATRQLSRWLVSLQIALALVLVIGAGLLGRTLGMLTSRPLGFDSERVLIAEVDAARSPDALKHVAIGQLIDTAAAVPGVSSVAASRWTPLSGQGGLISMSAQGLSGASETGDVNVLTNFVSPGWFAVYGTPLKAGRDFHDADADTAPEVVAINEAFVRRFLPGQSPLGQTISGKLIVAVVGDAVYRSSERVPGVSSLAFRAPVPPTLYAPLAQVSRWNQPPSSRIFLSVRARSGAPGELAQPLRTALTPIDPNLAFEFRPLSDDVASSLAQERLSASVSMFLAMLAALLAMVGLYGVTSYAASCRLAEIGVRLALGATRGGVVMLMLRHSLVTVAAGIVTGLMASLLLTRILSSLLFGISVHDPATYVAAAVLLTAAACVAVLVPAHRASLTDPAAVLRQ